MISVVIINVCNIAVQSASQRGLPVPQFEARSRRAAPAHQQGTAPHHQAKWPSSPPPKDQSSHRVQPPETSSFRERVRAHLHSISNYCECHESLSSFIILLCYIIIVLLFVMLSVYTLTMVRVPWWTKRFTVLYDDVCIFVLLFILFHGKVSVFHSVYPF